MLQVPVIKKQTHLRMWIYFTRAFSVNNVTISIFNHTLLNYEQEVCIIDSTLCSNP